MMIMIPSSTVVSPWVNSNNKNVFFFFYEGGGAFFYGVCSNEALSSAEFWKQVIYWHATRLDLLKGASYVNNGTEYFNQIHLFLRELKIEKR